MTFLKDSGVIFCQNEYQRFALEWKKYTKQKRIILLYPFNTGPNCSFFFWIHHNLRVNETTSYLDFAESYQLRYLLHWLKRGKIIIFHKKQSTYKVTILSPYFIHVQRCQIAVFSSEYFLLAFQLLESPSRKPTHSPGESTYNALLVIHFPFRLRNLISSPILFLLFFHFPSISRAD